MFTAARLPPTLRAHISVVHPSSRAPSARWLRRPPLRSEKNTAFDLFGLARTGAEDDFAPDQRAAAAGSWSSLDDVGRAVLIRQTLDLSPGVRLNLSLDDFRAMLARYALIDTARLTENLRLFLAAVVPVAAAAGVRLAIHPADPPFPVLGLPRIVSTEAQLRTILALVDSPATGLCYCTGSLGARADNDLAGIVQRLGPRAHRRTGRTLSRRPCRLARRVPP